MRDPLREPNSMTGKKRKQAARGDAAGKPALAFDPIRAALREIHDGIAAEGIPDDFLDLLDKLDDATAKRDGKR